LAILVNGDVLRARLIFGTICAGASEVFTHCGSRAPFPLPKAISENPPFLRALFGRAVFGSGATNEIARRAMSISRINFRRSALSMLPALCHFTPWAILISN